MHAYSSFSVPEDHPHAAWRPAGFHTLFCPSEGTSSPALRKHSRFQKHFLKALHIYSAAQHCRLKAGVLRCLSPCSPPSPAFLPAPQSGSGDFFPSVWPVLPSLHLKMTSYFPLWASLSISRCSILRPYSLLSCRSSRLYSSLASVTERCFPPVQPIPMTSWVFPSEI